MVTNARTSPKRATPVARLVRSRRDAYAHHQLTAPWRAKVVAGADDSSLPTTWIYQSAETNQASRTSRWKDLVAEWAGLPSLAWAVSVYQLAVPSKACRSKRDLVRPAPRTQQIVDADFSPARTSVPAEFEPHPSRVLVDPPPGCIRVDDYEPAPADRVAPDKANGSIESGALVGDFHK